MPAADALTRGPRRCSHCAGMEVAGPEAGERSTASVGQLVNFLRYVLTGGAEDEGRSPPTQVTAGLPAGTHAVTRMRPCASAAALCPARLQQHSC